MADDASAAVERLHAELAELRALYAASRIEIDEGKQRELALEAQLTATAEILRVIATSPTDAQPVLDAVAERARLLSDSQCVILAILVEGDRYRVVAKDGDDFPGAAQVGDSGSASERRGASMAIRERRTIHIRDSADPAIRAEFPDTPFHQGITRLNVPLVYQEQSIGALSINRDKVRPYSPREIALVEAFAQQAAIAIANARLFEELQESNRRVTTALEQQTALGDVLRVIASSPADLQQVLDALVMSAARLCGADVANINRLDGDEVVVLASTNRQHQGARSLRVGTLAEATLTEGRTLHLHGSLEEQLTRYPNSRAVRLGYGAQLSTPLIRGGQAIGLLSLVRAEHHPFSDVEIGLFETFADQAVIAIENARLFSELQERVAELRTLGEIGHALSGSLDLQETLGTIVASATRLTGADGGVVYEYDEAEGVFEVRAADQMDDQVTAMLQVSRFRLGEGAVGRAGLSRAPVQVEDLTTSEVLTPDVRARMLARGVHSVLAVPLLREGQVLGGLVLSRQQTGAFPDATVELLQTLATQSALAIHNARLYAALEAQGRALAEASQHKSQFLANMSHELRTPLNAVIGYSEMLQEELEDLDQAELVPDVQKINAAGRHLLGLINDILDLSKIEAGKMELFVETVDVAALVRDVSTTVGPLVEKNGNTLVVDVASDVGEMETDATKLRQILFNLLGNAAKFTNHGRIELRVERVEGREARGEEGVMPAGAR